MSIDIVFFKLNPEYHVFSGMNGLFNYTFPEGGYLRFNQNSLTIYKPASTDSPAVIGTLEFICCDDNPYQQQLLGNRVNVISTITIKHNKLLYQYSGSGLVNPINQSITNINGRLYDGCCGDYKIPCPKYLLPYDTYIDYALLRSSINDVYQKAINAGWTIIGNPETINWFDYMYELCIPYSCPDLEGVVECFFCINNIIQETPYHAFQHDWTSDDQVSYYVNNSLLLDLSLSTSFYITNFEIGSGRCYVDLETFSPHPDCFPNYSVILRYCLYTLDCINLQLNSNQIYITKYDQDFNYIGYYNVNIGTQPLSSNVIEHIVGELIEFYFNFSLSQEFIYLYDFLSCVTDQITKLYFDAYQYYNYYFGFDLDFTLPEPIDPIPPYEYPEVELKCPEGYYLDYGTGFCVPYDNLDDPYEPIFPVNDTNDPPTTFYPCPDGYIYYNGSCVKRINTKCPDRYNYSSELGQCVQEDNLIDCNGNTFQIPDLYGLVGLYAYLLDPLTYNSYFCSPPPHCVIPEDYTNFRFVLFSNQGVIGYRVPINPYLYYNGTLIIHPIFFGYNIETNSYYYEEKVCDKYNYDRVKPQFVYSINGKWLIFPYFPSIDIEITGIGLEYFNGSEWIDATNMIDTDPEISPYMPDEVNKWGVSDDWLFESICKREEDSDLLYNFDSVLITQPYLTFTGYVIMIDYLHRDYEIFFNTIIGQHQSRPIFLSRFKIIYIISEETDLIFHFESKQVPLNFNTIYSMFRSIDNFFFGPETYYLVDQYGRVHYTFDNELASPRLKYVGYSNNIKMKRY